MKTVFAVAFALVVALFGSSAITTAWADSGRPSVFPVPTDPWKNWPPRSQGQRQFSGHFDGDGHFNRDGHFRGNDNGVFVAPGGPRVVPGYFFWNGYAWVWVPAY